MSQVATNPNEAWRNFTTQSPITACKLRGRDDLKRLYRILNQKQVEHGERVIGRFFKTENETEGQFQERCTAARNAFVTTVRVTAENGEVVTGHGEGFFDSQLMPEAIASITLDTGFSPTAILKYTPTDRATIFLDFSKPPLLDLSGQPSAPTPNNSNFFISAETEAWFTSLRSRLSEFLAQRPTSLGWIHKKGMYDALLLLVGLPMALWGSFRLGGSVMGSRPSPSGISTIFYVYLFFLLISCFRALFSYSRWAFPRVEIEDENSVVGRHRAILSAIVLGILGSAVWDAIKWVSG